MEGIDCNGSYSPYLKKILFVSYGWFISIRFRKILDGRLLTKCSIQSEGDMFNLNQCPKNELKGTDAEHSICFCYWKPNVCSGLHMTWHCTWSWNVGNIKEKSRYGQLESYKKGDEVPWRDHSYMLMYRRTDNLEVVTRIHTLLGVLIPENWHLDMFLCLMAEPCLGEVQSWFWLLLLPWRLSLFLVLRLHNTVYCWSFNVWA